MRLSFLTNRSPLGRTQHSRLLDVCATLQSEEDNAHCLHWSPRSLCATVCRDSAQNFHDDLITNGLAASSVRVRRVV
jgi:hypothetical protein